MDDERLSPTKSNGGLRRLIGPVTALCVGLGVAIGSGVFAAPGEIAEHLRSPWLILAIWLAAGAVTFLQSLVTAELATRLPRAGGDYQFLKEAYGPFAAFFFGWSYTVFIVGGGAGTIAAALGEFAAELLGLPQAWGRPLLGCTAVVIVTAINAAGLRTGALTQNVLTMLKTAALLGIAAACLALSGRLAPIEPAITTVSKPSAAGGAEMIFLAMLPALWSYAGATDTAKLAEEITDVRRSLPRALLGAAVLLTAVYCLYNYALLAVLTPEDMAGHRSVPAVALERLVGFGTRELVLVISVLVCFGAISSSILSTVRVTYALARDGMTLGIFGRMTAAQAPLPSLILAGAIACAFVLNRSFGQIMRIYYLASAVLYGMSYASLIVFRLRDRRAGRDFPATAYKAPAGVLLAAILILLELGMASSIIVSDWRNGTLDSLYTLALLAGLAVLYVVWMKVRQGRGGGRMKCEG